MFGPYVNFVKETKYVMTPWGEIDGFDFFEEVDRSKVPAGTIIGLNIRMLSIRDV